MLKKLFNPQIPSDPGSISEVYISSDYSEIIGSRDRLFRRLGSIFLALLLSLTIVAQFNWVYADTHTITITSPLTGPITIVINNNNEAIPPISYPSNVIINVSNTLSGPITYPIITPTPITEPITSPLGTPGETSSGEGSSSDGQKNQPSNGSPATPVCTDAKPASAPKLLSVEGVGPHEVKLIWAKASDPVTYYSVTYGLKSGEYIFGNPNVGDRNTTSTVIGNLDNNITYYFKVEAVNNCMPGDFSNEGSVKILNFSHSYKNSKVLGSKIKAPSQNNPAVTTPTTNSSTNDNTISPTPQVPSPQNPSILNNLLNLVKSIIPFKLF